MFFAIAALLMQPHVAPQLSFPSQRRSRLSNRRATATLKRTFRWREFLRPLAPVVADAAASDTSVERPACGGIGLMLHCRTLLSQLRS